VSIVVGIRFGQQRQLKPRKTRVGDNGWLQPDDDQVYVFVVDSEK
jgi:hypothetical protein